TEAADPASNTGRGSTAPGGDGKARPEALAPIRLERNLLEKRGQDGVFRPWFPTAIDAPGASAIKLRDAGFDILNNSMKTDPRKLQGALERGALIMGRLRGKPGELRSEEIIEEINNHPMRKSVAFWYLGDHLGRRRTIAAREEELANIRDAIAAVRNLEDDVSHLTLASVDGDLGLFARAPS